MDLSVVLQPTPAGLAAAALAVVAGAPIFSDGLRSLRLARAFRSLQAAPVADALSGLARVRGTVALESPMFSPLSGTPCAGFRLEVFGPTGRVARPVGQFRPFRLSDDGSVARVNPEGARCHLSAVTHRDLKPGEALSQNLAAILGRSPEIAWNLQRGVPLTITERVLAAGAEVHVIGTLRRSRMLELAAEETLAATGTDDAVASRPAMVSDAEPECWIGAGDHLDFLLISDREPEPTQLRISPLRIAGAFVGPALSLGGLLMLADAADRMRALGG